MPEAYRSHQVIDEDGYNRNLGVVRRRVADAIPEHQVAKELSMSYAGTGFEVGQSAAAPVAISRPLSDIVVLDMTHLLAGPHCTMTLADLGAEVLKIESPRGDVSRHRIPSRDSGTGTSVSAFFSSVNRGKKSVVLDLAMPAARHALDRLLGRADVFVTNYRPATLERLGVSPETLRDQYGSLIVVTITGFGFKPHGAISDRPGLAIVAEAMSGVLHQISTLADGRPIPFSLAIGDHCTGITAAAGIMAALIQRSRTGQGTWLDISMVEALMALNSLNLAGEDFVDESGIRPAAVPFGIYPVKDGAIVIAVNTNEFWHRLLRAMGRPELSRDPRFTDERSRHNHLREIDMLVAGWAADLDKNTALRVLVDNSVPCAPVNDPADVLAMAHFAERGAYWDVPDGIGGSVRLPGNPLGLVATTNGPVPRLGEHTESVLRDYAELTDDEIHEITSSSPSTLS